jgi:hypothetical protein
MRRLPLGTCAPNQRRLSVWIEIAQISLTIPAGDPAFRICSVQFDIRHSDRDLSTLHALAQLLTRNYHLILMYTQILLYFVSDNTKQIWRQYEYSRYSSKT